MKGGSVNTMFVWVSFLNIWFWPPQVFLHFNLTTPFSSLPIVKIVRFCEMINRCYFSFWQQWHLLQDEIILPLNKKLTVVLWSLICLENALQYSDKRHSGYPKYYCCTAGGLHAADVSSMLLHGYLSGFLVQMFMSEHAQPPLLMFFDMDFIVAWLLILKRILFYWWGATCVYDYIPVGSAATANNSICRYLLWAFLFSLHFLLWLLLIPRVFYSGDSDSSANTLSPSLSSCRRDDSLCTLCPDGIKNFIASWFFLSLAAATVT